MKSQTVTFAGILIMAAFFTGCATPYDLKKTDPVVTYSTKRPGNEVKKCIMKKWREHINTVLEEKTSTGWLVRHNDTLPNATIVIVTIDEMKKETKVNYYHRTEKIRLHRLEEEVIACK